MPRLTIPEPEVNLYKDGFDGHDKLSRKPTGANLSGLVERINDPLVIALDGAWGSGKSLFLKCWVGEHLKRDENSDQTIYFDAFAHDYLDDPLIALTGAIAERFAETDDVISQKAWAKAKKVAPALGRAILRTSISVATAGLVSKADEITDAAINTVSDEFGEAINEFWKREDGKRAAMKAFHQSLTELTKPSANGAPTRKLIIVIDELDRCRPDYALSLLEIIKHFFNVDGVHFVLGVNLSELQNSVRARYGNKTDAATYLQKFYSITLRLPRKIQYTDDYLLYFLHASGQMQIPRRIHEAAYSLMELYKGEKQMTPRTVQRILTVLALLPTRWPQYVKAEHVTAAALLKICAPSIYEKMRVNAVQMEDLRQVFDFDAPRIEDWNLVLHAATSIEAVSDQELRVVPRDLLPEICETCLEVFDPSALQTG